nr:immunoglobulin heavy chain junction region [Macaca mulatta]
CTRKQANLDFW